MFKLICHKPSHFLAQMAVLSSFLQEFIVLGMDNFGLSKTESTYMKNLVK